VLIGLSGGIDSTLVAAVAADALGPAAVTGIAMPSPWSSSGSLTDAEALAHNLGIRYEVIPISPAMKAVEESLAELFEGTEPGVAEENIQSRLRGIMLMAMSNKFGDMVLATGNKSEYAVGYATLYGDMAGGYAVIKDVPKVLVFQLCEWRNANHTAALKGPAGPVIPHSVIDKPPSAELRPDQRDTDSLPPYEVLDPILEAYVEQDRSIADIVAMGYDQATVERVVTLVDRAEYKRRQAAPGVKITPRAFGRDRRVPITNGWHDDR
jgi:NAD+ synthase